METTTVGSNLRGVGNKQGSFPLNNRNTPLGNVSLYSELQVVLAVLASLIIAYLGDFNILSDIGTLSAIRADSLRKRLRSMAGFVNNTT
ncbi:MAG: hypothetical protein LBR98_03595 [Syntrophomonadaceae bacterium]|jgi:hypothetical protein|nr:hypothetical protein [Syntrophomonadaceae bacterium]